MSLLHRLFRGNGPIWKKIFKPTELEIFYNLVIGYLKSQNRNFDIKNGYVVFNDNNARIDLRNIAQVCSQTEQSQWQIIIENFFQQLETVKENAASNDRTFAECASILAVRLWPEGTLKNVGAENMIYRVDLEGTISTLVLDFPDSIHTVIPKMANSWGKSQDELFKIGLDNVYRRCKPDVSELTLANGIKTITLSKNGDFFAATHILFIDEYPNCIGLYGSLIGIPHRDIVVCYPINDKQVAQAIQMLAPTINNLFIEGPGSISPYLYWYHDGCYETIRYIEKGPKLVLPPKLMELFNSFDETKHDKEKIPN